jgi:hypothetical protein
VPTDSRPTNRLENRRRHEALQLFLPAHPAASSRPGSAPAPTASTAGSPLHSLRSDGSGLPNPNVLLLPAIERLLRDPAWRIKSVNGTPPPRTCFRIATICSTENRFHLTANLPSWLLRFCRKLPSDWITNLRATHAPWVCWLCLIVRFGAVDVILENEGTSEPSSRARLTGTSSGKGQPVRGKGRVAPRSAGNRTWSEFPSKLFKLKEVTGVWRIFPLEMLTKSLTSHVEPKECRRCVSTFYVHHEDRKIGHRAVPGKRRSRAMACFHSAIPVANDSMSYTSPTANHGLTLAGLLEATEGDPALRPSHARTCASLPDEPARCSKWK